VEGIGAIAEGVPPVGLVPYQLRVAKGKAVAVRAEAAAFWQ
jgi:hypothetical protein